MGDKISVTIRLIEEDSWVTKFTVWGSDNEWGKLSNCKVIVSTSSGGKLLEMLEFYWLLRKSQAH